MSDFCNVFDWLDDIREKPGMYLGARSLRDLETLICGYYAGLHVHGIVEVVPEMIGHFRAWLHRRTKWACNCGWAFAIDLRFPDRDTALAKFFALVNEYRMLKPAVFYTVRLTARHKPTGKRMRVGFDKLMAKPQRVEIVRYRPEPLYFLRFHYRDRTVNGEILTTPSGDCTTTVRYAMQWMRDELLAGFDEWDRVKK